jgi:hypothetical protein
MGPIEGPSIGSRRDKKSFRSRLRGPRSHLRVAEWISRQSDIYDAANQARLEDFRRLQARIRMIWGKADAYLNVGLAEEPAIAGEECLASPDPSRALATD